MDRPLEFYALAALTALPIVTFFTYFLIKSTSKKDWASDEKQGVNVSRLGSVDLLGLLLFVGIFSLSLISISEVGKETKEITLEGLLNVAVFHGLMATMVLCVLAWRVNIIDFFGLNKAPLIKVFGGVFVGYASMMLVGIILHVLDYNSLIEQVFGKLEMQESVQLLRESNDLPLVITMVLLACIIAPIAEEIVFRGYIYPVMKKFSGRIFAMIASSLFFATIHVNMFSLLPLFILAVILVLLYERYKSLWVPIGLHMVFNTSTVVAQLLLKENPQLLTP